jgi:hypothetical protein
MTDACSNTIERRFMSYSKAYDGRISRASNLPTIDRDKLLTGTLFVCGAGVAQQV